MDDSINTATEIVSTSQPSEPSEPTMLAKALEDAQDQIAFATREAKRAEERYAQKLREAQGAADLANNALGQIAQALGVRDLPWWRLVERVTALTVPKPPLTSAAGAHELRLEGRAEQLLFCVADLRAALDLPREAATGEKNWEALLRHVRERTQLRTVTRAAAHESSRRELATVLGRPGFSWESLMHVAREARASAELVGNLWRGITGREGSGNTCVEKQVVLDAHVALMVVYRAAVAVETFLSRRTVLDMGAEEFGLFKRLTGALNDVAFQQFKNVGEPKGFEATFIARHSDGSVSR